MREFRDTRIEISAGGDIELLDFALSSWGLGEVERNRRWLNIKRLEYLQFAFTIGGKRTVFQPFRAAFKRSAANTYTVTTRQSSFLAEEAIKQAGFTVVKVEQGPYRGHGFVGGTTLHLSVRLNGRSLNVHIVTK